MRAIRKQQPPRALADYLRHQMEVGVNLDYDSFTRKRELREELIAEQFGLCAFTGAAIDQRLTPSPPEESVKISVHNAHLKPRSICRQELLAKGGEPGRVLGEDMDYHNILAALMVEGARDELFGGAAQADQLLPVKPTEPDCESRFNFYDNGAVEGGDADARHTVSILNLNHRTLRGWRQNAIEAFIDPSLIENAADLDAIIAAMDAPRAGRLPEYCFAIKQVAQRLRG
jgi:hypothetical protein